MPNPSIKVEDLSKMYLLGHQGQQSRDQTLRDTVAQNIKNFGRKTLDMAKGRQIIQGDEVEEFWALKDISFALGKGDALGIVGRNGAGKSTLLKVLSRITEPSRGRVTMAGRVASLLEVGTGFHPELTGRENIFLNGAILGMSRAEIRSKFDEIVDFAGVEKFLDTPVKRYSSGMYVRLAFSVAAHLEPDILIVDEVLAVGDAEFQKKCLGKLESVSNESGKTVLFVSHNMSAISKICSKALWLENGKCREIGRADLICGKYLSNGTEQAASRDWINEAHLPGNEWVQLRRAYANSNGETASVLQISKPLTVTVEYEVKKSGKIMVPNLHFLNEGGTLLFIYHDWHSGWRRKPRPPGIFQTTFEVPANFFAEGRITVHIAMGTYTPFEAHFVVTDALSFMVVESDEEFTARGDFVGNLPGVVRPILECQTEIVEDR